MEEEPLREEAAREYAGVREWRSQEEGEGRDEESRILDGISGDSNGGQLVSCMPSYSLVSPEKPNEGRGRRRRSKDQLPPHLVPHPRPPTTMIPTKRIISRAHLQSFLDSPTYADLVAFVTELNESVKGVKLTDEVIESPVRALHPCPFLMLEEGAQESIVRRRPADTRFIALNRL
jgi:hypothetical protein